MNFQEAVSYIYGIPKFTTKNSLEHTKRLLGMLGHPGKSFRILHVAGSNGKGSVCAFAATILKEAGIRVGLFTSPHLCTIRERFVIDGQMVSEEAFLEDFHEILALTEQAKKENLAHPTFFEFIFLMAMVRFEKENVDVAVLETGLGGRLDATNAPKQKDVTVITSISLEHTDILGDTIEQIAAEKAGILRQGTPVIYDAGNKTAAAVIEQRARQLGCASKPIDMDKCEIFLNTAKGIDFCYHCEYDDINVHIGMGADYQVVNAMLAMEAAAYFLPQKNRELFIKRGLERTRWPGRMEEVLPGTYLDGAHNPDGIKAFLQSVHKICRERQPVAEKPILLFSIVKDKNYEEVISLLLKEELWSQIIVTRIDDKRAMDSGQLKQLIEKQSTIPVYSRANAGEAFALACASRQQGQLLFCTGSLYLVGELEQIVRKESQEEIS